jgi:hypothetical protein
MNATFSWSRSGGPGSNLAQITKVAHAALDSQIIKDTDPFVPFRTGMLASSPIRAGSQVGLIEYKTPYARSCYYGVNWNFRKVFHPQATHHWLEKAKVIWFRQWVRIVNYILTRGGLRP